GGMFFLGDDDDGGALPQPLDVVRRYADGREERVRGVRFTGVQRFVLRDIVVAGESVETTFMAPFHPGGFLGMGPTEGMPTWVRAPEVLVGEMELVPEPGDPRELPVIPPPPRGRTTAETRFEQGPGASSGERAGAGRRSGTGPDDTPSRPSL